MEKNYPNIKIIPAGFSDPSRVLQVASAMILQHPKKKGIYAPWAVQRQAFFKRSGLRTVTTSRSARWICRTPSPFRSLPAAQ